MGTMVIDSVPPATATSYSPEVMLWAAWAMDCRPDEQKRLMVMAGTVSGRPARKDAGRATFMPCSRLGHGAPEDDVLDVRGFESRDAR